jgi:hypothetical protein
LLTPPNAEEPPLDDRLKDDDDGEALLRPVEPARDVDPCWRLAALAPA